MHNKADNKPEENGTLGKVGGHIVREIIEEMEERMAGGEHVSAAPSSHAEAELLNVVKQENRKSAEQS